MNDKAGFVLITQLIVGGAFIAAFTWITRRAIAVLEKAVTLSHRKSQENRIAALTPPADSILDARRRAEVWSGILEERARQDAKFGRQCHHWPKWISILGEEYGEICKANLEGDELALLDELEQLAAVSVAALEHAHRAGLYEIRARREEA